MFHAVISAILRKIPATLQIYFEDDRRMFIPMALALFVTIQTPAGRTKYSIFLVA